MKHRVVNLCGQRCGVNNGIESYLYASGRLEFLQVLGHELDIALDGTTSFGQVVVAVADGDSVDHGGGN